MTPDTLSLAARNAAVLQALAAPDAAFGSVQLLAEAIGKDRSNLRKTLDGMAEAGLVAPSASHPVPLVTDAGRRALQVIAAAEGEAQALPAGRDLECTSAELVLNPLNPRKTFPEGDEAALADSIELSGGNPLVPLLVYPRDLLGQRLLFAGERRKRAIDRLIREGRRDAQLPIPCREIQPDADQAEAHALYVALTENGGREGLRLIEEARAYAGWIDRTGISASAAARATSRDPRTVQEMVKVVREAEAEDIARHETQPDDYSWEWLRNRVKAPKTTPAHPTPAHPTFSPGPGRKTYAPPKPENAALAARLSAASRVVLLEVAHAATHSKGRLKPVWVANVGSRYARCAPCDMGGRINDRETRRLLGFPIGAARNEDADDPFLGATDAEEGHPAIFLTWRGERVLQALAPQLIDVDFDSEESDEVLEAALRAQGVEPVAGGYLTDWLASEWRPKATPPAQPEPEQTDIEEIAPATAPRPSADPEDLPALTGPEATALAEIAHKADVEGVEIEDGVFGAAIHAYWTSKLFADLAAARLVKAVNPHKGGGWYAVVTERGQAWLDAHPDAEVQQPWATGFLHPPAAASLTTGPTTQAQFTHDAADADSDIDEEEAAALAQATAILAQVGAGLQSPDGDWRTLAEACALKFPCHVGGRGDGSGDPATIYDAEDDAILTIDVNGDLPDPLACARAMLIAACLNGLFPEPRRPGDRAGVTRQP